MTEAGNNHFFFQSSQSSSGEAGNGGTIYGVFVGNSWNAIMCRFPLLPGSVWWSVLGFLSAFPAVQSHLSKESSERREWCEKGDPSARRS